MGAVIQAKWITRQDQLLGGSRRVTILQPMWMAGSFASRSGLLDPPLKKDSALMRLSDLMLMVCAMLLAVGGCNSTETIDTSQEFCRRLGVVDKDASYRLRTEAEWECACRAGSEDRYCFGNELKEHASASGWCEYLRPCPQTRRAVMRDVLSCQRANAKNMIRGNMFGSKPRML